MTDTSKQAGSSLLPDSLTQLTKIAGLLLAKLIHLTLALTLPVCS